MEILNLNGFVIELGWGFGLPLVATLWSLWLFSLAAFTRKMKDGEADQK